MNRSRKKGKAKANRLQRKIAAGRVWELLLAGTV
jgi:hypothetical protein